MIFAACLVVFAFANVVSLHVRSDGGILAAIGIRVVADGIKAWGFPFQVSEVGGLAFRHHFSWLALLGNVAIAVVGSAVAALAVGAMNSDGVKRAA